jgi:hypothetical protein
MTVSKRVKPPIKDIDAFRFKTLVESNNKSLEERLEKLIKSIQTANEINIK